MKYCVIKAYEHLVHQGMLEGAMYYVAVDSYLNLLYLNKKRELASSIVNVRHLICMTS